MRVLHLAEILASRDGKGAAHMSTYVGDAANAPKFQTAAKGLVRNTQVRTT